MPIKLPKGFQRRKSSGTALEEVRNPPEPSFKVFERPGAAIKPFDGGHVLKQHVDRRPVPPPKQRKFEVEEDEDLFSNQNGDANNRGSGGTLHSGSTTGPSDSAASSARLSTSSTNHSSSDTHMDINTQRPFHDIPVPPTPPSRPAFSLRNRGISFGSKAGRSNASYSSVTNEEAPLPPASRDRALTASSASTATPPRLTDSDLAIADLDVDGFGKMFDNMGTNRLSRDVSKLLELPSPPPPALRSESQTTQRIGLPARINTGKDQEIESSPFSAVSEDSRDGLMRSPSPSKTVVQEHISPLNRRRQDYRTPKLPPYQKSTSPLSFDSRSEAVLSGGNIDRTHSLASNVEGSVDQSIVANAQLASQWTERGPGSASIKPVGKVMTTAQFEQLKRQQEKDRIRYGISGNSSSDEESDPNYEDEDDDEAERDKQAVKQRRKQEAHLAVYRQTMMKVTGEQANRPTPNRSTSSLNGMLPKTANGSSTDLSNRLSHNAADSGADADEDEDVPLGILAAHGFPNKNRPPTRLANSPSNSNLRGLNQASVAPATPSVAGESMRRGSLPVFARNLPQDPYFPSLVNPTNRESLAMNGGASAQGAPGMPQQNYPVHPAGLVGVIAGEERARAMRRGSPNAQGNYETPVPHPGMARSYTTGNLNTAGHPMMQLPPGSMALTPGDQAQIQMAQQMQQFMQMQQQMMQQMISMQGGGQLGLSSPGAQLQSPQSFLVPPMQLPRPQSMPMPSPPVVEGRSMSTLNPGMAHWNRSSNFLPTLNFDGKAGYTPSIAPSERSNVGMASRYRPVSTVMDQQPSNRSSTFTSSTMRPFSTLDPGRKSPGTSATVKQVPAAGNDDEDDDRGWMEMKMKRDKKKSTWRMKKDKDNKELGDYIHGTA